VKKLFSSACVLSAAALWGIIALFYDGLSTIGFTPLQIVWLRTGTAAILTLLYVLIRDPSLLKIRLKDSWMFFGSGVISLAFFNFCYFRAIDEASASTAAVLLYTAPIFVMIMSVILFKEQLTFAKVFALVLTVIGCICVTEMIFDTRITAKGVLFGLGAGIGYALYTIFGKIALRRYRTETITIYTFVFATIFITPFCGLSEIVRISSSFVTSTVLLSLGIGFFVTLLPYLLYTKGLQNVPAGQASVIATLEPVVATVCGVLFLDNTLTFSKLLGIALIIGAILMISLNNPKDKEKHSDHK